jgi:hypothetical protein
METLETVQTEENKYLELIKRLESFEEKLSFSSISRFAKSPRHFIEYKLQDRVQTPAMLLGSLVDCMVLTPDDLEDRYVKADCDTPTTDAQKGFVNDILSGIDLIQAYLNHYKPSSNKPESIQKAADKKLNELGEYIEFCQSAGDREMIDVSTWEQAERMTAAIYKNDASKYLLDQTEQTQIPCEWEFGGFNWRGFRDAQGEHIVWDLKITPDAHPKRFGWKVFDMLYHWQAALYTNKSGMKKKSYYIAAVDRDCHVSVHEITEGVRDVAITEMEEMMKRFKKCVALNEWSKSYDFHAPHGIYKISGR